MSGAPQYAPRCTRAPSAAPAAARGAQLGFCHGPLWFTRAKWQASHAGGCDARGGARAAGRACRARGAGCARGVQGLAGWNRQAHIAGERDVLLCCCFRGFGANFRFGRRRRPRITGPSRARSGRRGPARVPVIRAATPTVIRRSKKICKSPAGAQRPYAHPGRGGAPRRRGPARLPVICEKSGYPG